VIVIGSHYGQHLKISIEPDDECSGSLNSPAPASPRLPFHYLFILINFLSLSLSPPLRLGVIKTGCQHTTKKARPFSWLRFRASFSSRISSQHTRSALSLDSPEIFQFVCFFYAFEVIDTLSLAPETRSAEAESEKPLIWMLSSVHTKIIIY
jgi:hypothetical protein